MTAQVIDRVPAIDATPVPSVVAERFRPVDGPLHTDRPHRASERPLRGRPAPRVRCARSEHPAGYAMSRWQRLAMTIIVAAAVVVTIIVAVGGSSVPVGGEVIARPGDTVGSIVLREMPGVDPLRAAELVGSLNGLTDGAVPAGSTVLLPALP